MNNVLKKIASFKEALQIIENHNPKVKDSLLVWLDGDINELERLKLPPAINSPELTGSWAYLEGVREVVLELIPDFEEIHWTDLGNN